MQYINNIKGDVIEYYSEYSQIYIQSLIDRFISQERLWRCIPYAGWGLITSPHLKQQVHLMIQMDKEYIKKKLILLRYCHIHNFPSDILANLKTSLFS
jgi:hypothetical protein